MGEEERGGSSVDERGRKVGQVLYIREVIEMCWRNVEVLEG